MKILTLLGAFFALDRISKMFTELLSMVPKDWQIIRLVIAFSIAFGLTICTAVFLGMFTVYGIEFMVNHWPF